MLQRRSFCRFCGCSGVHRFGIDRKRRQRWKCPHCGKVSTRRTNTARSGSRLSDDEWGLAVRLFASRGGMSGADVARVLGYGKRTGQRLNRAFRQAVIRLAPMRLPGPTEWDESVFSRQWVLGGVSRLTRRCILTCIANRTGDTLVPIVDRCTESDNPIFTDEHCGYIGLLNRWTVCHSREFVNSQARFVHTNRIEGVWGHAKELSRHVYRGFPSRTLSEFLAEFCFRYNVRSYRTRLAVLSTLLTRPKTNSLVV